MLQPWHPGGRKLPPVHFGTPKCSLTFGANCPNRFTARSRSQPGFQSHRSPEFFGARRGPPSGSSARVRRASPTRKFSVPPHFPITLTVTLALHLKKPPFRPDRNPLFHSVRMERHAPPGTLIEFTGRLKWRPICGAKIFFTTQRKISKTFLTNSPAPTPPTRPQMPRVNELASGAESCDK